ncbi:MAG TPA: carboxypeptidase-like regulatory domain-containing protein, partial [Isosphaeraceae bacterium]|nr:carboxypeptidase-like regulatory domain-containing protein [Isosphaeraceae bacterium]
AGFASWTQIHAAWSDAKEKYQVVVDRQRAVRDGQAVLARTLEALVCLIPYLEATHQPQLQSDWLEAAETAGMLARLLEPPRPKEPPVEGLGSRLHEATRQLERLHRNLLRAFQHDQVEVLVRQCRSEAVAPEPGLAAQIDALLTTPLLAAQDRPALWAAHRLLERRLQQRPPRGDSEAANPAEAPRDRARRRFDRMAAFLKLAGDEKNARRLSDFREILVQASELTQSTGADIALNMSDPARAWAAMARCAELAYFLFEQRLSHGDRDDAYDRVGWLAPVYVAGFDDWAANPLRQIREQDALTAATWLANHYRYWSLDLHEWIDPDNFLEAAARECPTKGPSPPEIYPRIDVPAVKPSLSPKVPSVTVALPILLAGADAQSPQKVILSAEKPDDRRLTVTVSEPIAPEIGTESPTPANLTVTWTDEAIRGAAPPPAGFLVRARMPDNLTYHALVPLAIVASGTYPGLALSSDPVQSDDLPMDDLRLRPMAGKRQPFFVFVKNPSSKLWKVIVEVWEGDKLAAWSGTNEKPLEVPANSSRVVPAFATAAPKAGEPPPKPDAPLPRLAGPLRLRLRDVAGTIVDEQPIRPAIAAPREYIEVRKAQFTPAALGQPNRLTVELQALPQMTGPPCPVDLVLPMDKELFPTLLAPPKDGTLTGTLEVGKPPVILFAEKIPLSPGADAEGSFYVNVDGVKRALWFRSRFPEAGGPQRTIEPRGPRVRFHPVRLVESGKPARLRVEFEVDNAPPDARLAFRLGRFEDGQFKDDLERWSDTAQRRQIGFDPKGEGGALLFEASVEDWVREWLVPNLLGRRTLRAQLLDARGRRVLDSHELELVLDDRKPRDMAIDVPDRIEKGTKTLTVKATVTPPASRIKEVAFIFGKEAEFDKAVAEDKAFKGQPADLDGRTWTATLPVPKDATRELIITARFKTGVDLTAFAPPGVVAVIEPAREDEKTAKPAPSKPGAIEGIVTEADRPQPNLVVYLNDPTIPNDKPGAWKAANTDSKGTFSFKDLEPKRYRLYCAKNDGITNRVADKPNVMVESGQTVKVTLELVK